MVLPFYLFTFLPLFSQSSFTQRLQQSKNGEGKITVTQDKAIDELVNGPVVVPARPKTNTTTQQKPTEKKDKDNNTATNQEKDKKQEPKVVVVEHHDSTTIDAPEEVQKKIMKGVKVAGYRVQVFAGGNTRNDRLKAERIGSEIKGLFPGVPVYIHFVSVLLVFYIWGVPFTRGLNAQEIFNRLVCFCCFCRGGPHFY